MSIQLTEDCFKHTTSLLLSEFCFKIFQVFPKVVFNYFVSFLINLQLLKRFHPCNIWHLSSRLPSLKKIQGLPIRWTQIHVTLNFELGPSFRKTLLCILAATIQTHISKAVYLGNRCKKLERVSTYAKDTTRTH